MHLVPIIQVKNPDRYDSEQWLCFENKSETMTLIKIYPKNSSKKYVNEIRNIKKSTSLNIEKHIDIDEFNLIENYAIIYEAGDCSLHELNEQVKSRDKFFSEYTLISFFQSILK